MQQRQSVTSQSKSKLWDALRSKNVSLHEIEKLLDSEDINSINEHVSVLDFILINRNNFPGYKDFILQKIATEDKKKVNDKNLADLLLTAVDDDIEPEEDKIELVLALLEKMKERKMTYWSKYRNSKKNALHVAIEKENIAIVKILCEHTKAVPDAQNLLFTNKSAEGHDPFDFALVNQAKKASPNILLLSVLNEYQKKSLIKRAIESNHYLLAITMLKSDSITLPTLDEFKDDIYICGCKKDEKLLLEILKRFNQDGIVLSSQVINGEKLNEDEDKYKGNLLHIAIEKSNVALATEALKQNNINKFAKNQFGCTALELTLHNVSHLTSPDYWARLQIIAMLVESKEELLNHIMKTEAKKLLQFLLVQEENCLQLYNLDAQDYVNIIFNAVEKSQLDIMQAAMNRLYDLKLKAEEIAALKIPVDQAGNNALHLATINGQHNIVYCFCNHQTLANLLHQPNAKNETPYQQALAIVKNQSVNSARNHLNILYYLIDKIEGLDIGKDDYLFLMEKALEGNNEEIAVFAFMKLDVYDHQMQYEDILLKALKQNCKSFLYTVFKNMINKKIIYNISLATMNKLLTILPLSRYLSKDDFFDIVFEYAFKNKMEITLELDSICYAFHKAIKEHNHEMATYALQRYSLYQSEDTRYVKRLTSLRHMVDEDGNTLLHLAVHSRNDEMVCFIINLLGEETIFKKNKQELNVLELAVKLIKPEISKSDFSKNTQDDEKEKTEDISSKKNFTETLAYRIMHGILIAYNKLNTSKNNILVFKALLSLIPHVSEEYVTTLLQVLKNKDLECIHFFEIIDLFEHCISNKYYEVANIFLQYLSPANVKEKTIKQLLAENDAQKEKICAEILNILMLGKRKKLNEENCCNLSWGKEIYIAIIEKLIKYNYIESAILILGRMPELQLNDNSTLLSLALNTTPLPLRLLSMLLEREVQLNYDEIEKVLTQHKEIINDNDFYALELALLYHQQIPETVIQSRVFKYLMINKIELACLAIKAASHKKIRLDLTVEELTKLESDNQNHLLHLAVLSQQEEVVAMLCQNLTCLSPVNTNGETPLDLVLDALKPDDSVSINIIMNILCCGLDKGVKKEQYVSALLKLLALNHFESVIKVLSHLSSISLNDCKQSVELLHLAISLNQTKIAKMLLKNNHVNVNTKFNDQNAFVFAITLNRIELASYMTNCYMVLGMDGETIGAGEKTEKENQATFAGRFFGMSENQKVNQFFYYEEHRRILKELKDIIFSCDSMKALKQHGEVLRNKYADKNVANKKLPEGEKELPEMADSYDEDTDIPELNKGNVIGNLVQRIKDARSTDAIVKIIKDQDKSIFNKLNVQTRRGGSVTSFFKNANSANLFLAFNKEFLSLYEKRSELHESVKALNQARKKINEAKKISKLA